jgi:hypothetical protein
LEWLPVLFAMLAAWLWTDGLTNAIEWQRWFLLGLIALGNLFWISVHRHADRMAKFIEKYPAFRMNKHG